MRIGILLALSTGMALPQTTPTGSAAFEVVSIKPHPMPPGQMIFRFSSEGPAFRATGSRFVENVATLQELIMDAYSVKEYQITGLPDWAQTPRGERFDIVAKSPGEATPTADQLRSMLQSLLADRFELKLHRDMKELPVYALVVGKNGSKLREISEDELKAAPTFGTRQAVPPATMRGTVSMLMPLLANVVDRPLTDHTGLTGRYEYANLDWRQLGIDKRAGALDPDSGQSVFTAVQEQLGLKLEPRKEPTEILVIDRAERPSAN